MNEQARMTDDATAEEEEGARGSMGQAKSQSNATSERHPTESRVLSEYLLDFFSPR